MAPSHRSTPYRWPGGSALQWWLYNRHHYTLIINTAQHLPIDVTSHSIRASPQDSVAWVGITLNSRGRHLENIQNKSNLSYVLGCDCPSTQAGRSPCETSASYKVLPATSGAVFRSITYLLHPVAHMHLRHASRFRAAQPLRAAPRRTAPMIAHAWCACIMNAMQMCALAVACAAAVASGQRGLGHQGYTGLCCVPTFHVTRAARMDMHAPSARMMGMLV